MKNHVVHAFLAAILFIAPIARADTIESPAQIPAAANAATASLSGVKCVLRAQNGQTKFRQGETIPLVASFTSDRPGYKITRFVRNDRGMATLGAVKVSPAANVTDPIGELPPPNFLAIAGYVPPPVALGEKPVEFPFVLNDWARFDKPGVYQITLATVRVFVAKPDDRKTGVGLIFNSSFSSQITSQPLQIEITPADEAWANQQIGLWQNYWQKNASSPQYSRTAPPQNDISFLGTRAAMTAIIEHLGHNILPRSSSEDTYQFHTGFVGFADRDWLISEMKRAIEQPNYAVTQGFFDLLTELETLRAVPRPVGANATPLNYEKNAKGQWVTQKPTPAQQLQIDWINRRNQARDTAWSRTWLQVAAAVESKSSAARAMTLHSLLELAWLTNLEKEPPIKRVCQN